MADLFLLSEAQMRGIKGYFPLPHGIARVDDRRIVSAIVFVIRNGLRWRDAPREYGPHKTITTLHPLEPPGRVQQDLRRARPQGGQGGADHDRRHASEGPSHRRQPFKKGPVPRRIGRTKGGLNSKLHAICDGQGRPFVVLLSEGQMNDFKGAALMLPSLPKARELLADKGYDADWFRQALAERKTIACIPSKSNAKSPSPTPPCFTDSVIKSRTCSDGSRTGGASTPVTTVAPTPISPQSASPQPSSSGCDQ
jgi:transposase